MFETTYIFIGVLATGTAFVSILQRFDWETRMLAAGASFVLWTVWMFSSYNVEKAVSSGSGNVIIVSHRYGFLAFLGLIFAAIMFLYIIMNILEAYGMDVQRMLGVSR